MDLKGVSKAWSCTTLQAGLQILAGQPQPGMPAEPWLSGSNPISPINHRPLDPLINPNPIKP